MVRLSTRMSGRGIVAGVLLGLMVSETQVAANEQIEDLESAADQWINLKIRASKERSDWKSERVLLESTIRSLETEQELLKEEVASNELAADLYSKNRDKVASAIEEKERALDGLRGQLIDYETRLQALLPRLPEPLAKDIRPMVGKLGDTIDEQPVSVATRMQSLVTILTTIDQFNNSLTVTHELRRDANGQEFDTRVIYWGLAFGFAVDSTGQRAWRLSPAENGWAWRESPEIAKDLLALIEIYERNREPELIQLPVALTKGDSQ